MNAKKESAENEYLYKLILQRKAELINLNNHSFLRDWIVYECIIKIENGRVTFEKKLVNPFYDELGDIMYESEEIKPYYTTNDVNNIINYVLFTTNVINERKEELNKIRNMKCFKEVIRRPLFSCYYYELRRLFVLKAIRRYGSFNNDVKKYIDKELDDDLYEWNEEQKQYEEVNYDLLWDMQRGN